MKLKTKYEVGDKVKYFDEEFKDNGICKCCDTSLQKMQTVKSKGKISSINIRVEKDTLSIEYEINNDFIEENQIIKRVK